MNERNQLLMSYSISWFLLLNCSSTIKLNCHLLSSSVPGKILKQIIRSKAEKRKLERRKKERERKRKQRKKKKKKKKNKKNDLDTSSPTQVPTETNRNRPSLASELPDPVYGTFDEGKVAVTTGGFNFMT